jgi:addiction module HigA family antidote
MHNPPHPGEVLQDTVLRTMTITELAKRLEVSRVALSRVVNGRAAVSAELAIRLAAALRGSAESWMRMQVSYALWHAQKQRRPRIRPIGPQVLRLSGEAQEQFISLLLNTLRPNAALGRAFKRHRASIESK